MKDNVCSNIRVGIQIIGEQGWLGGITYVELLIKALRLLPEQERPKISLIVDESKLHALDVHKHIFPLVDGFVFLGLNHRLAAAFLKQPFVHCRSLRELANHIDFLYPVNSDVVSDVCSGSWIPDFQHVHLPEFFSKEELVQRDGWFQKIASYAKIVVLSSRDAEQTFRSLYPAAKALVRVLSFHTLMPDDYYVSDPVEVQKRYGLPDRFVICSNQFWAHKNHAVVFEALARLHRSGELIDLVCTGSTVDYRFPEYFSGIKRKLTDLGIENRVRILGTLPRNDQLQLMRRSLAVIQPSLFEGWSTVVEDARALGKTMLLSDLAVHFEQAPDHGYYFDRKSPDDLAEKLAELLPHLKPGPDALKEQEARTKARELVLDYARQFCSIAVEAQSLCAPNIISMQS